MENKAEIWKALPGGPGVEVSTLGRVRTLDRLVSSEKYTRFTKGRVLKQYLNHNGYLRVCITIDGKWTKKRINRLVAQTFIPNPDNLPQVNHKDCDRTNNNIDNLEWCTASYNAKYRENHGVSQAEAVGHPLFAINLETLEILHFRAQMEASRALRVFQPNISNVIKGKTKQAGGYLFVNDDGNAAEVVKNKLHDIGKTGLKI